MACVARGAGAKEVRPSFLGDNSIWSFPSDSSLSDLEVLKAILTLRS